MSEVVVVAEIGIVSEKRDEALAALKELGEATHEKEGCQIYALQLDPADESHVFMIEKWDSAETLQKHGATDRIKPSAAAGTLSGAPRATMLQPPRRKVAPAWGRRGPGRQLEHLGAGRRRAGPVRGRGRCQPESWE